MKKVDFFVVGAPKCGTTTLHNLLRKHPEIYMPEMKDRPYFGRDMYPEISTKEHQRVYKCSDRKKLVGESCVWYLYSRTAAKEIKTYNPSAKIIIMIRNPVDFLYSLHSEFLFGNLETEKDFNKALELEARRKEDKFLMNDKWWGKYLLYSNLAHFSIHINRFYNNFPKKNIKIIIFDEFVSRPDRVYREVLTFLGVNNTNFNVQNKNYNPSKTYKSRFIQKLIAQPPRKLKNIWHKLIPMKLADKIIITLFKLNSSRYQREPMPRSLRDKLIKEYASEVKNLGKLTEKSLSSWKCI